MDQEKRMTFWEHLDELLSRLKIIFISVITSGLIIGFWPVDPRGFLEFPMLYQPIISIILQKMKSDLLPSGTSLIAGGLMDTAYIYIMMAFLIGFVVSSPIIGYELYAFINPALYPSERRMIARFLLPFLGLFIFGVVMAYLLILPLTFKIIVWFIVTAGALPLINIKDFYMMIITLLIGSGLLYTVPLFLVTLVQVGILSSRNLTENRKLLYVGFLVLTAVITPDPTIITDLIILLPFITIFESAIFAAKRVEKNRDRQ
ncbi:MAG: twin-arginine translocase subunit TatC [Candidatus Bathyarchaeia archaeon]